MPDWSYHPLFKPLLTKMKARESRIFIHKSMNMIASNKAGQRLIAFLGHMEPSTAIGKEINGIHFKSPVGLSHKIDPRMTASSAFAELGFGFLEIGPVTINQSDVPDPVRWNEDRHGVLFNKDMETINLFAAINKIKKLMQKNISLMVKIKGEENDLQKIISALIEYSPQFVLDMGSLDKQMLSSLIATYPSSKFYLSLPVYGVPEHLSRITDYIDLKILHGIVLEESETHAAKEWQEFHTDKSLLLDYTKMIRENTSEKLPIISVGGVAEPKDALILFDGGIDLILLSSDYILTGPGLPKRINESIASHHSQSQSSVKDNGWIAYQWFGIMIFLAGILALLFSLTKVILPYDEVFLKMSRTELLIINNKILQFMSHDRMTLAGTMISGGILYTSLARNAIRHNLHWARKAFNSGAITGFLGILLFIGYGYFDWLHGLFWAILLPFFITGFKQSRNVEGAPASTNLKNHRSWKIGLYGQLCFILLGFSLAFGGIVISLFGVTTIFVPTDLTFICMSADQLEEINDRLLPVIAHDRAGFGSALFSVGLLVLMMALWGYREGEAWLWRSFLFGGLPAFLSGIITHFLIGYITFIHILPVYIALALFIGGLVLSYSFLHQSNEIEPNI